MSNSNSDPSDKPEKANANEFRRSTKSINERPHSALKNSKDLKVLSQSLFEKVIVDESCTVYPSMEYSLGDDAKLMTLSPKLDKVAYVEEKVHKVIIATITISDHDHRGITIEHLTDFFTVPQFKTAISSKGCFYYIASTERHVSVYSPGDVNIASSTYLGNGPTYTGIKTISGYRVALTWSTDRMVRFWHVNHTGFTLRELGSFSYGKAIPNVVEAFSTADYCITGLSDGQIDFRNLSSLSLRSFQPFTKPISGLALSPRNQYISACSEGTVTLISLKTGYISWNKFTKPVGTGFILKFVYFFGELNGVGAIVIYELPEGRQELLKPVLTLTYGCQRIPESVATTRNMIGVRFKSTKEEAKVGPAGNS